MEIKDFPQTTWFSLLDENGKRLVQLSIALYEREVRMQSPLESYSFLVFPMAKAFEGFIKLYLKKMGLLNRSDYNDSKFRIGRALNPDISEQQKNEWWLYDDVARQCGEKVARNLWDSWIQCRNRVFHYYFNQETEMSFDQARKKLEQMAKAMEEAMACELKNN
jgi:hypothetical protein